MSAWPIRRHKREPQAQLLDSWSAAGYHRKGSFPIPEVGSASTLDWEIDKPMADHCRRIQHSQFVRTQNIRSSTRELWTEWV